MVRNRRAQENLLHGVLNINKPSGMTSHDVVDRIRRAAKMRQVGHAGTLDPIATGVLPICVGKATKIAQFLLAEDKGYEGEMLLGTVTDSQDITGKVLETRPVPELSREQIEEVFRRFTGDLDQVPPMVSAKHHKGKRLYELARQGLEVERPAQQVKIWELEVKAIRLPYIDFRVHCSKGTYIRTLCHDMGEVLGPGATMNSLVRTRCGSFSLSDAVPLDDLSDVEHVERSLSGLEDALSGFPLVMLAPAGKQRVLRGQPVRCQDVQTWGGELGPRQLVRLQSAEGEFLALAKARLTPRAIQKLSGTQPAFLPVKVFYDEKQKVTTS
jgi:tRNA pseudouridine55 synthase